MTQLYLIRHTQAEGNRYRMMQGHWDGDITSLGKEQIEALSRRFENIPIDAVYASDLQRAVQTARIAVPSMEPVLCPELREWHLGVLQGHPHEEAKALFPEAYEILCAGRRDDRRIPDGESMNEMIARSVGLVEKIVERHRRGRVLIVSHGGTIRAMRRGLTAEDDVPALLNTSLSRMDYVGGQWKVVFWNDFGHLEGFVSANGEH